MSRRASRADWAQASVDLSRRNAVAARLFATHGPPDLPPVPKRSERFRSLASSITAQQVSGKAAESIFQRVVNLVGDDFSPQRVLDLGPETLRTAGLSGSKAISVVDLATHCVDGSVHLEDMGRMDDDDVIDMLVQVRGIGVWTAQMVLLFDLRRLDVWPTGDLGVRVGFGRAFELETSPTPSELLEMGEQFAPYRSVMAWWSWRSTGPPTESTSRRAQRQAPTSQPSQDDD